MRVYWVASISTGRRCEFALTVVVGHNHQATTFKCANDGRRNHLVAIMKNQTDIIISQIYFWNKTLQVSDSSSVHHQEFFTLCTAVVCAIQVCWQLASRFRTELSSVLILLASWQVPSWSCTQAVNKRVWPSPLLCAQCKTPDGRRNCKKHVEFYSKNKFEKLVHLVGFVILRIYHDTRRHLNVKVNTRISVCVGDVVFQHHTWPACLISRCYLSSFLANFLSKRMLRLNWGILVTSEYVRFWTTWLIFTTFDKNIAPLSDTTPRSL